MKHVSAETSERASAASGRVSAASGRVSPATGRVAATSERASEQKIVDLATALVQANEARGVTPDGWTPSARWKREVDIPEEVLGRAEEAILG